MVMCSFRLGGWYTGTASANVGVRTITNARIGDLRLQEEVKGALKMQQKSRAVKYELFAQDQVEDFFYHNHLFYRPEVTSSYTLFPHH